MIGSFILSVLNFRSDARSKLALERHNEILWQQYLNLEARVVASDIKRRAWRERTERGLALFPDK